MYTIILPNENIPIGVLVIGGGIFYSSFGE